MLHKSVSDWLHEAVVVVREGGSSEDGGGGGGGLSEWKRPLSLGHELLAKHLVATDLEGAAGNEYGLKYAVFHVCKVGSGGGESRNKLLDTMLGDWDYLRCVFEAGHGAKMLKAVVRMKRKFDGSFER